MKNILVAIAITFLNVTGAYGSPDRAMTEIEDALSIVQSMRRTDPGNSQLRRIESRLFDALDELDSGSGHGQGYTAVRIASPALNIQCNDFNDPADNAGGAVNVRNAISSAKANVISQCRSNRGYRCQSDLVTLDFAHDGSFKCTVTAHLD
jgi:hypothetical protein